jgi:hypothetical protein
VAANIIIENDGKKEDREEAERIGTVTRRRGRAS